MLSGAWRMSYLLLRKGSHYPFLAKGTRGCGGHQFTKVNAASRLSQSLLRNLTPAHKSPFSCFHLTLEIFSCQFSWLFKGKTVTIWNKFFSIHSQSSYFGFFILPIYGHLSMKILELIWSKTLSALYLWHSQWPDISVTHLLLHSIALSPIILPLETWFHSLVQAALELAIEQHSSGYHGIHTNPYV